MTHKLLGQTLDNRYRFEHHLGESGTTHTFRITDLHHDTPCVAKVLKHPPDHPTRLQREVARLVRLEHPHIARCLGMIELGGHTILLRHHIAGESLLDKVTPPLPTTAALTFITPLAAALYFAHHSNILHLNLKPSNILLDETYKTLVVTDFYLPHLLHTPPNSPYTPPEQRAKQSLGVTADIYALGALLRWLLSGETPNTPQAISHDMPLAVQDIITRSLHTDPTQRYQSVQNFHDALVEAVGAPPIHLDTLTHATEEINAPTEMKLPEWSQFMGPVPSPEAQTDAPANKLAAPPTIPHQLAVDPGQVETDPHLEDSHQKPTMPSIQTPPPTIPAQDHVAAPPPSSLHPAHQPYNISPRQRRSAPAPMIILLTAAAVLLVAMLCLASLYLLL